jgi:hypothetical protein
MIHAGLTFVIDLEDQKIIDKFTEYLVRNGPDFEAKLREKEKNNPKFAFLFGGENSDYFLWKKSFLQSLHLPSASSQEQQHPFFPSPTPQYQYPPHSYEKPPPIPYPTANAFPVDPYSSQPFLQVYPNNPEEQELVHLLEQLSGSTESIKEGKNWILQRPQMASDISLLLRSRMQFLTDPQKRIHLLYLINDVLYHAMKAKENSSEMDEFTKAMLPHLGPTLQVAYQADPSEQNRDKIAKVVSLWGKRNIFDDQTVAHLEKAMHDPKLPSPLLPSPILPPNVPPQSMNPGWTIPASTPPYIMQQPVFIPPPQPPPYHPSVNNIPMGVLVAQLLLLPQMPPYTPINIATLNITPILPLPNQTNATLSEHVDQFYSTLRKKKEKRHSAERSRSPSPHKFSHVDIENKKPSVGSGKPPGVHEDEQVDPFLAYRKAKSYTHRH